MPELQAFESSYERQLLVFLNALKEHLVVRAANECFGVRRFHILQQARLYLVLDVFRNDFLVQLRKVQVKGLPLVNKRYHGQVFVLDGLNVGHAWFLQQNLVEYVKNMLVLIDKGGNGTDQINISLVGADTQIVGPVGNYPSLELVGYLGVDPLDLLCDVDAPVLDYLFDFLDGFLLLQQAFLRDKLVDYGLLQLLALQYVHLGGAILAEDSSWRGQLLLHHRAAEVNLK